MTKTQGTRATLFFFFFFFFGGGGGVETKVDVDPWIYINIIMFCLTIGNNF